MGRIANATWGRLAAAGYDWFLSSSEQAGLSDRREELLSSATGRTIEIGAGTGLNLAHYPDAVGELVVVEPDRHMAKHLRARVAESPRAAEVVQAPGEALPFPDDSFDTAVVTLVLCTAPDPDAVLAEIARVLVPGGRLLFMEHVRSDEPEVARWQDRLHRPWKAFGNGCHCNRATLATISASPFEVESVEHGEFPKAPSIVRPLIVGTALAPS
jgi:ubiquinone/menaquinone biosynthesis C-methylase UbiE